MQQKRANEDGFGRSQADLVDHKVAGVLYCKIAALLLGLLYAEPAMRAFSLVVLCLCFFSLQAQTGSTSGPDDLARASDLLSHGHPAEAIAILQKLAAVEPPIAGAEHELGTAYYSVGNLAGAKEAFAKAIEQDKSDQDSVQMEGLTLYRLDRPDAAIPYLERVVRANPNVNADAQTILGLCFIRLNNYDDARSTYATLFGQPPDSAASFLLLATILRQMDFRACGGAGEKGVDIAPQPADGPFRVGRIRGTEIGLCSGGATFRGGAAFILPRHMKVWATRICIWESCPKHKWL